LRDGQGGHSRHGRRKRPGQGRRRAIDEDHALDAVRTAIGIQEAVNGRTFGKGATLKTRCGNNTGDIMIGAIGAKDRLIFTVHGDTVNIATRLEQLNKEYGIYILATENTVTACGDEFTFEQMGKVTVRGH
jgi:adenylate cyclase